MQNHLMEFLLKLIQQPFHSFESAEMLKNDVLDDLVPLEEEDIIVGQYDNYLEHLKQDTGKDSSDTPTYAKAEFRVILKIWLFRKTFIRNFGKVPLEIFGIILEKFWYNSEQICLMFKMPRWRGTRFVLEAGKALPAKKVWRQYSKIPTWIIFFGSDMRECNSKIKCAKTQKAAR